MTNYDEYIISPEFELDFLIACYMFRGQDYETAKQSAVDELKELSKIEETLLKP